MITVLIYILVLSVALCIYRMGMGSTPPDRAVALDILGTLMVGFCALLAILTEKDFYINIAISWALLSYVGTIALGKFLENRGFDE
ncbi:MAG TPA: multiple resistance and pH regulation protein F [candidate division Zixibacteria bacterium]|nr:multiple resistance and pH regulation protein F [candidate division Zixibacteria bacterium]